MLLILAGISIAMLTGDNGILAKASKAKIVTEKANLKEQIGLAVMAAKAENNGKVDENILEEELEKAGITGDMIEKSSEDSESSTLPWTITKGTSVFEVDKKGNVTEKKETIQISDLTVKDGNTVLTDGDKSIAKGTPLTISFTATIAGGTITSISPSVPYTPEAEDVKTSETFVIKGTTADGKLVEKKYVVNLKGYYDIPELKVGDYVNYTPNSVTDAQITSLNTEINTNSGKGNYSGELDMTTTLSQENLEWRVLEIDETTGNPIKLISAESTSNKLKLFGANGYNNAVYLLNKACRTLYNGEFGNASSLTIEDVEKYYSNDGKNARNGYTNNNNVLYGGIKRYTSDSSKYPKMAEQENGMGINTETYTDAEGNVYNTIKTNGIDKSKQAELCTTGGTTTNVENGITVTQTYYNLNSLNTSTSTFADAYTDVVYHQLFHLEIEHYWLASRCVDAQDNGWCWFNVYGAHQGGIGAYNMFASDGDAGGAQSYGLRPVISLKSGVEADYVGENDLTYNIWNLRK